MWITYALQEGPDILEFGCEGNAFSLRDRELRAGVIKLAAGVFKGCLELLKYETVPMSYWQFIELFVLKLLHVLLTFRYRDTEIADGHLH